MSTTPQWLAPRFLFVMYCNVRLPHNRGNSHLGERPSSNTPHSAAWVLEYKIARYSGWYFLKRRRRLEGSWRARMTLCYQCLDYGLKPGTRNMPCDFQGQCQIVWCHFSGLKPANRQVHLNQCPDSPVNWMIGFRSTCGVQLVFGASCIGIWKVICNLSSAQKKKTYEKQAVIPYAQTVFIVFWCLDLHGQTKTIWWSQGSIRIRIQNVPRHGATFGSPSPFIKKGCPVIPLLATKKKSL